MRKTLCALALGLTAIAGPAGAQDANTIFAERSAALLIDDRCGLFDAAQRAALDAARLQARGALLRGGMSPARLDAYAQSLQSEAAAQPCDAPSTIAMRDRVVLAFEAYIRLAGLDFPGGHFDWQASRRIDPDVISWTMLQDTGSLRVGITANGSSAHFSASDGSDRDYASVVLVLRDVERQPDLYDPTLGGFYPGPEGADWARWTPPEYAKTRIWASDRLSGDDAAGLTDTGGDVYRFPASAVEALVLRDPREAARIEFLDRRGQTVATEYFEIGDFAAALAFLQAGGTQAPPS